MQVPLDAWRGSVKAVSGITIQIKSPGRQGSRVRRCPDGFDNVQGARSENLLFFFIQGNKEKEDPANSSVWLQFVRINP